MDKRQAALQRVERSINRREIDLDTSNEVAMANKMILHCACNLNLNELKLLRLIIMQTKKGDKEFFEFELSMKDFADILGVNVKSHNLYRNVDKMTTHIMQEVIAIYNGDDFKKFHWVDYCEHGRGKIRIKIADALKPYLLNLRGSFTRYELDEIIKLNSVYAIRIYEILRSFMNDKDLPYADHNNVISINMDVLRKATGTEKKFERFSNFKAKVIDTAVNEINRCSKYHVTAEPYKDGNKIVGFDFLIESQAGYDHRQQQEQKTIEEQIEGQMNFQDYGIS